MQNPLALVFSGAVVGVCFCACLYVAMDIQTHNFMLMQKTTSEANTHTHKPNFIQNSLVNSKTLQFTCCVSFNTQKSKQIVNCFTIWKDLAMVGFVNN